MTTTAKGALLAGRRTRPATPHRIAIQTLLCEDPLLGAWEGRLAAWAARTGSVGPHRAWLQGLAVECGLGGAKKLPPRQLRFAAILSENRERPRRRSSARPSW